VLYCSVVCCVAVATICRLADMLVLSLDGILVNTKCMTLSTVAAHALADGKTGMRMLGLFWERVLYMWGFCVVVKVDL